MSSQVQPQQPVQIYPNSVSSQPLSDHSNGSFGTVFIVLAVIIVISAIACFLGRLCNRRYSNSRSHNYNHNQKPPKYQKQNHPDNFRSKEGDIEMGFDKRIASSKPKGLGLGHGHGPRYGYGRGRGGPKHPSNYGDMKGFEMKLGHDGELRAGA